MHGIAEGFPATWASCPSKNHGTKLFSLVFTLRGHLNTINLGQVAAVESYESSGQDIKGLDTIANKICSQLHTTTL